MEVLEIKATSRTEELIEYRTILETKEVVLYYNITIGFRFAKPNFEQIGRIQNLL